MGALRIGSVCTGYGGLDMAVQAVFGGELAWVADNDPGASRILAHRHPGVPNLGDITAADFSRVAAVDVVCGGYPCQPFSSAGKRKGVADARHIWPHIARALGVLRPRYAVFENVAGHLSLGFDAVLADLAALGFDARWCTLRASDVGAAHQRNRLFVVAWPADAGGEGLAGRRAAGAAPDSRRLAPADPVDLGEHRSRARGTGRDEPAARRLPAAHPAGHGRHEGRGVAHECDGPAGAVGQGESARGGAECVPEGLAEWGEYADTIARWEKVLQRTAPGPVDAVGRLSPVFVEWLMGLPAGHVTAVPGLSRSAQLKALGNGVVPHQAVAALRFLAPTLPARAAA
ncbi:DNA cytosine methyltransferase [Streptomyces lydicus]|uniref:DNA cytosine methyltransferase n=1 Tax=Streptomyces lydicus TaxID=47763 RepID=UPI001012432A|nr:DNA cytosine methyltransferase [Streptomyces lydicus]MCZ1008539.1 DNA cytosine methyltransferase [Streptomyces lydicus]